MVVQIALSALRGIALRKAANATAKIRRLEKTGIRVAGSLYDPRREVENVKRYTRKQLNAYVRNLDEFTSRSTKFVRGAGGAAISKMDMARYEAAQTVYNLTGDRLRARNANLPMPGQDVTVGEARGKPAQNFINAPDNTILPYVKRSPESFPSAEAIRRSRNLLYRRMGSGYVDFRKRSTIQGMNKAFRKMGLEDVSGRFNALSDRAKHYLIFDADFTEYVYQAYPAEGETGSLPDNENILNDIIDHAEQLFGHGEA